MFTPGFRLRVFAVGCPWVGEDGTERHQSCRAVQCKRGRNARRTDTIPLPPHPAQDLGQATKLVEGLEKWKSRAKQVWVRRIQNDDNKEKCLPLGPIMPGLLVV